MSVFYQKPNGPALLNSNIIEYYKDYLLTKEPSNFEEVVEISDLSNRNIYISDIDDNIGSAVETLIRFYNQVDSQMGIEIEDRIPIKIWIYSGGGSLSAGFTICEAIEISETPVWTINQGQACSAAALIYICGHRRLTFKTSTFLLHEGSAEINQVDAHKFQNFAEYYKAQLKILKQIVLSHTNISEEEYSLHSRDDWWFDGEEAVEKMVADEIITKGFYNSL